MIFYRVLTTVPVLIQKKTPIKRQNKKKEMSKFLDYYHLLNIPEEKRHNNNNNSGIGQPATLIPPHELRQAYKRALLHHHPDKQKKKKPQESTSSPTTYPPAAAATIDEITEAYRVLGNASERAKYDVELRKWKTMNNHLHQHHHQADVIITTRHTGMEIVDLEELDFEGGGLENEENENASATATATGNIWKRACRCGSIPAFVVTEAELEKSADEGELVTGCKGCSLWLKVMFTVDDD